MAVATPAARPSWSERLTTKRTLGPGITISAKDSSANAARCPVGSISRAYRRAGKPLNRISGGGPWVVLRVGSAGSGRQLRGRAAARVEHAQDHERRGPGVLEAVRQPARQVDAGPGGQGQVAATGVGHALALEDAHHLVVGMAVLGRL